MQVVLEQLWAEHGEDPAAWPKDVVASLGRRNAELARQVSMPGWHRSLKPRGWERGNACSVAALCSALPQPAQC